MQQLNLYDGGAEQFLRKSICLLSDFNMSSGFIYRTVIVLHLATRRTALLHTLHMFSCYIGEI